MRQLTLATATGFEPFRKTTRREVFLAEMNQVVPWADLCAVIAPVYPQPAGAGRRPVGVERMLRIYFLQQCFNLSDPAVEEALYDSTAMRIFVGLDLGREPVPDETTVCRFRHVLETHQLGLKLFETVNRHLAARGLRVTTGTIVDATIINAPSSTKNATQARDPEMHQTAKGKQWYFGMKAHVGVDSRTKLIHSVTATAANVADATVLPRLLHGDETRVYGDQAYRGQTAVIRHTPLARRTSPTGASGTAGGSMRSNGGRMAPRPKSRPRSSMQSGSSNGSLASRRCGIAASPKIRIGCLLPVRSRMCSWSATACSGARDSLGARCRPARNRRPAAPIRRGRRPI